MATFMSGQDPWCTDDTGMTADMYFGGGWTHLWDTIEMVLKKKIRPLFTKQRNPNITNEGRKDFHPVPLPRFDGSALDDSAKPWKNTDIYATTVLSWIVSQYKVCVLARGFTAVLRIIILTPPLACRQEVSGSALPTSGPYYPSFNR